MKTLPIAVSGLRRLATNAEALRNLRERVRLRISRQALSLAFDLTHIDRVRMQAFRLAHHFVVDHPEGVDVDVLDAACLLHELGRGQEEPGENRGQASARLAEDLLRAVGLADLVWPVCETILTADTASGRKPSEPEAKLLHDAHLLDDLGAIGLWRFALSADLRGIPALYPPADPGARERDLDPAGFLLDALPTQAFALPERMMTPYAKVEAERRVAFMRTFYQQVLSEATPDSPTGSRPTSSRPTSA